MGCVFDMWVVFLIRVYSAKCVVFAICVLCFRCVCRVKFRMGVSEIKYVSVWLLHLQQSLI